MHATHPSPPSSSQAFDLEPSRRARAGKVLRSVLTTLCGGVTLLTAAAVLDPATLRAGSREIHPLPIPRDAHQDFARSIASMLSQSQQVLAVRPASDERGAEVVLWFDDVREPGQINADELMLIRHSLLFRTVTIYSAAVRSGTSLSMGARVSGAERASASASASENDVMNPAFIDRWRAMPDVQARVVGAGISDMNVEAVDPSSGGVLPLLRLHLRWDADSVDGIEAADEVSMTVQAGRVPFAAPSLPEHQE